MAKFWHITTRRVLSFSHFPRIDTSALPFTLISNVSLNFSVFFFFALCLRFESWNIRTNTFRPKFNFLFDVLTYSQNGQGPRQVKLFLHIFWSRTFKKPAGLNNIVEEDSVFGVFNYLAWWSAMHFIFCYIDSYFAIIAKFRTLNQEPRNQLSKEVGKNIWHKILTVYSSHLKKNFHVCIC